MNVFSNIVEKQAPLKTKFLREDQAPFMAKEFCKAIYNRSRLRNKFCKIQVKKIKNYTGNKEISVSQSVKKVLAIISTKQLMGTS